MGFFGSIGKIMQGKPVFEADNQTAPMHDDYAATELGHSEENGAPIVKNNPSTFPVVHLEHAHTHEDEHHLRITAQVKNSWHEEVMVHSVRAFGNGRRLDISLQPEQAREVVLYEGPVFGNQQGSEAVLDYKTKTGDYFESTHDVHYLYTAHKTYQVSDIRLRQPIRDIYG